MINGGTAEVTPRNGATVGIPQRIVDEMALLDSDFEVEYFDDLADFVENYGDDAGFSFICISVKE